MMVNGLDRGVAVATTPSTAAGGVSTRAASVTNAGVAEVQSVDTSGINWVAGETWTLTLADGTTTLSTGALGAAPTLASVVAALKADADYDADVAVLSYSGNELVITYQDLGVVTGTATLAQSATAAETTVGDSSNPEVQTVSTSGFTFAAGQTWSLTLADGTVLSTGTLGATPNLASVVTALQADSDYAGAGLAIEASGSDIVITYSGNGAVAGLASLGRSFAGAEDTAGVAARAQVDTLTLSGNYSEGDVISVTVNNVDLDYTVTAADVAGGGNTTADYSRILTNLVSAFNASTSVAHTPVTAAHTSGTAVASFTAESAGTAFSAASTVDGAPALTLDTATTVSDGDEVKFFNPATTVTGASSTGVGASTVTISSNSAIQQDQYVFKLDGGVVTRVVDSNGDPITVSRVSGTTLTLSAAPSEDLSSDTLIFYNPVSYSLTMQDGSKVSMSGDLFSGEENQQFNAVTTRYEVYASLDDQFYNAGNNNFYSDVEFNAPVGGGLYKPVAEMQFWGGKNIDALVTNPVTGLPTFESQVVLTGKVTTPGNNPTNADPDLIFNLDLTGTRNYATPFGVDQSTQDGRSVALLNSVSIDDEGKVVGTYGDGRTFLAGQVVLVNFAATDGLVPSGNNVFAASYLSGDEVHPNVLVGKPGQKGLGGIRAGAVEGSNVDLANELVKLLIQQRMYSANSQSIRAFDDTLTTTIRMAGG
jgi:flagellar hook-basal body protein